MVIDDPLRERRDHDGAYAAAGEDESERYSAAASEPGEDGARVRELGGAVGDESEDEVGDVEALDAWAEPAERCQREREDQDGRKDDAARREAVEEDSDAGRDDGYGDCGEGEGAGDGLAMPAKGRMQWIEKQAERVGNDGREAHHDADECSRSYLPAGVVQGGFFVLERDGRGAAHGLPPGWRR